MPRCGGHWQKHDAAKSVDFKVYSHSLSLHLTSFLVERQQRGILMCDDDSPSIEMEARNRLGMPDICICRNENISQETGRKNLSRRPQKNLFANERDCWSSFCRLFLRHGNKHQPLEIWWRWGWNPFSSFGISFIRKKMSKVSWCHCARFSVDWGFWAPRIIHSYCRGHMVRNFVTDDKCDSWPNWKIAEQIFVRLSLST